MQENAGNAAGACAASGTDPCYLQYCVLGLIRIVVAGIVRVINDYLFAVSAVIGDDAGRGKRLALGQYDGAILAESGISK